MYYGIYVYIDPPNHPNAYIPYMERLGYTQILLVLCPKMDPDPWLRWPCSDFYSFPRSNPTQDRRRPEAAGAGSEFRADERRKLDCWSSKDARGELL